MAEFPAEPPPYFIDTTDGKIHDPGAVPFTYHETDDGSIHTWRGMWDPDQPEGEQPRRVVPDPDTHVRRVPMATARSASSSGVPSSFGGVGGGTFHWSSGSSSSDPWRPTMSDLTDAEKLRALADWFDRRDDDSSTEVQDDLREIARRLENTIEPTLALESALEEITDHLAQYDSEDIPDNVNNAIEVVTAWLSER